MLKQMGCQHCNKGFIAIRPNQKYCCKRCRLTACESKTAARKKQTNNRYNPKTGQPCWRCENACGKCSWSRSLTPVFGWVAEKVIIKDSMGDFSTYKIISCPKFAEE